MNKTKDFEWIEIKSSENDYNNFVIVRYDWPCNIQRITEVVSQFREERLYVLLEHHEKNILTGGKMIEKMINILPLMRQMK